MSVSTDPYTLRDLMETQPNNSRKKYNFVRGPSEYNANINGWRPLEIPDFDPVGPVMVPHDLMEHFPDDEYKVHGEYQAQGSMLYLRLEGGYFRGQNFEKTVIPPAFGMLFFHMHRKGLYTEPCPEMEEAHERLPQDTEFALMSLSTAAIQYAGTDADFHDKLRRHDRNVRQEYLKDLVSNSIYEGLGWMRIGYRRAKARFGRFNKDRLVSLFGAVARRAGTMLESANANTKMSLSIDYESYTATMTTEDALAV